jgi:hypothetical protein
MQQQDNRARLKQLLEGGENRLHVLTFQQREIWEATPAEPGDVSNNICCLLKVRGVITPEDCIAAIQRVVDRQEVLRLSFLPAKGQTVQLIRARGTSECVYEDVPASQRSDEAIEELAQQIFSKPFDLVQGPLYRVHVFRRAPDDLVMAFAIHHSIADGWSLGVFVEDLCSAYIQALRGLRGGLPPVPQTYSAWGALERAKWDANRIESHANFWKKQLEGAPRLWDFSAESRASSRRLKRWITGVSKDDSQAIRDLARRTSTTLFSTLLACFQIALNRWNGSEDIVVGTPSANRTGQNVRETMGYFSGVVPIRGHIVADRAVRDAIRSVHDTTVESFGQAMPFVELMRSVGESASPTHNPVFDVRFALQNHPIPDVELPNLSLKLAMRSTGTARFDLGCEVTEDAGGFEVVWLHRPGCFSQADLESLNRIFTGVLAEASRSPEKRLNSIKV